MFRKICLCCSEAMSRVYGAVRAVQYMTSTLVVQYFEFLNGKKTTPSKPTQTF